MHTYLLSVSVYLIIMIQVKSVKLHGNSKWDACSGAPRRAPAPPPAARPRTARCRNLRRSPLKHVDIPLTKRTHFTQTINPINNIIIQIF